MKKIDLNQFNELVEHQGTLLFCIAYMNDDVNQSQLHMIQTRIGKWYKSVSKDPQNWEHKAENATNSLLFKFIRLKDGDELSSQFTASSNCLSNTLRSLSQDSRRIRYRVLMDWVSVMSVCGDLGPRHTTFFDVGSRIVRCNPSHFKHLVNEAIDQNLDSFTNPTDDLSNASATSEGLLDLSSLDKSNLKNGSEEDIDLNNLLFGDDDPESFSMIPD